MRRFIDKKAFITGGAGGLGAAVCLQLAREGADIVLSCAPGEETAANEIARQCESHGVETIIVSCNITNEKDCIESAEIAAKTFHELHVLVNCAGRSNIEEMGGDPENLDLDDFRAVLDVNLVGTLRITKTLIPLLKKGAHSSGPPASIVNVSSLAGVLGVGSSLAYSASKGALNTLSIGLAHRLAPTIRVNTVCPAFINTGWFKKLSGPQKEEKIIANVKAISPFNAVLSPEDVSELIAFLSSPATRYVSGEVFPISTLTNSIINPNMLFK